MKILIDADGCPVVDLTVKIAATYKIECIIICDASHIFEKESVKTIVVTTGADSVDFTLVNMIAANDIVVTQDYGLAAMCMAKGAVPVNQNGMIYNETNIDALLTQRHSAKKIRMSGKRIKIRGETKRTENNNITFEKALVGIIAESKYESPGGRNIPS